MGDDNDDGNGDNFDFRTYTLTTGWLWLTVDFFSDVTTVSSLCDTVSHCQNIFSLLPVLLVISVVLFTMEIHKPQAQQQQPDGTPRLKQSKGKQQGDYFGLGGGLFTYVEKVL